MKQTQQMQAFSNGKVLQCITLKLGDELFAIDVSLVSEVLEIPRLTKVPSAPDYLAGVANVRGTAVPVIDLRIRFGIPLIPLSEKSRLMVFEINDDNAKIKIGGLADQVLEVANLTAEEISEAPAMAMEWNNGFLHGITRHAENFIYLLDIVKMLAPDETEELLEDEKNAPSSNVA